MAILEVEHLSKSFDRTEVLKDITFSLEDRFFQLSVLREAERRRCLGV